MPRKAYKRGVKQDTTKAKDKKEKRKRGLSNANTLPVMVASQTGSQGINWWSMAALATAAIAPLVIIGVVLERYLIRGMTAGALK